MLTLMQAISTGFDANYGLFTSTSDGLAYPQPAATKIPNGLGLLEFLGLVVGKALYEGILLDLPLAPFLVARLQGRRPMFDELNCTVAWCNSRGTWDLALPLVAYLMFGLPLGYPMGGLLQRPINFQRHHFMLPT